MFKINQYVNFLSHGVCKVKRIETKVLGLIKTQFYVLETINSNMTILLPISDTQIRELSNKSDLNRVKSILKTPQKIEDTTWNRRYREYMELLKSGSIFDVAIVLRSLIDIRNNKDLSFGERKMLDQAKELIYNEFKYGLNIEVDFDTLVS